MRRNAVELGPSVSRDKQPVLQNGPHLPTGARYISDMCGGRLSVVRVIAAIAGLLGGPLTAFAVPVTWEAQGSVESSDLGAAFFASFAPRLAGTQAGDGLVLRITFDTDAALIGRRDFPDGGTTYSFDASSLVLELEVPGRGTHAFAIDKTIPPGTIPSLVGITDDLVTPGAPIFDSLQFRHNYFGESGALQFFLLAVFSSTDPSTIGSGTLPLSPDPRLGAGFERGISIVAPGSGSLFATFSSLVRVPNPIQEPGSLALLCAGLAGLWTARRRSFSGAV
jgi:hypothetical protein